MALTRRMLKAMGIEEEKVEEIITAHTDTVNALKEERDQYKEAADELPNVQKELNEAKKKLAEGENDDYETKYNELKKEFDTYKGDVEAKETHAKKTTAYREQLKAAGVSDKRIDAILKVSPIDDIKFGEDGKVEDADKLQESIKEEWADFIVKEDTKGARVETPPNPQGGAGERPISRAAQVVAKHNEMMYGVKGEDK